MPYGIPIGKAGRGLDVRELPGGLEAAADLFSYMRVGGTPSRSGPAPRKGCFSAASRWSSALRRAMSCAHRGSRKTAGAGPWAAVTLHRVMPGFRAVAVALGERNLCPAPIAAVQLRLPDLPDDIARGSLEAEDRLIKMRAQRRPPRPRRLGPDALPISSCRWAIRLGVAGGGHDIRVVEGGATAALRVFDYQRRGISAAATGRDTA